MTRRLGTAIRVIAAIIVLLAASEAAFAQVTPDLFAGMPARSIGPAGMSGRIGAIDAVAANPNVIYLGTATGGLWKSTSGGVRWEPLTDSLAAPSIGAVAIFQAAPDIVWIGTGEKARRNSAGLGTGVYKSMDGGRTWKALGLENTGAISEIILDPTNRDVAYVAALGNTWSESADRGVYKTTDGGASWTKVLFVDQRTGVADLVMDPSNPNKLFAAMWEHRRWPWFFKSGGPGSGLYLTWDGGATWKRLTDKDGLPEGELGRIGLDIARGSPNVVYALVEAKRSVLLRSEDGGLSWKVVNQKAGIADRPFYYAQLRVDPENENRVYNVFGLVDVSEDGGKTFKTLLAFARVHPDHHAFWINPLDGRLLIDGNDGGVAISRDRGQGWQFVENLPLAQFYHINVDMETPFNIYGGMQDNGSWLGPSEVWQSGGIRAHHWKEVSFGDGFATITDPGNSRYGYAMSQGGYLVRFDKTTGEQKSIKPIHPQGTRLRFNWNAGIATDPFDGSIYYGSQFVHKTTDMGTTWRIISPDLTTNDPEKQRQLESGGLTYDVTGAENHTTILTIAPSPVERGVIWVGTDDGNVQLTRDGGATWTNVASRIKGVPAATWVPHIEPSKFDGGTAFVVFDDHRRGNNRPYVFRTTDHGRSWTSLVTSDLEAFNFVHVVEQDPVSPSLLFLGTEYGTYVSLDGGARWMLWRHGLPRVSTQALIVHPRDHDLVVGTHGRAAYVLDDVRPLRALAADAGLVQKALHLFDVPPTIQYRGAEAAGMRFVADGIFSGTNRPYGALLTYLVKDGSDSAKVTIEILDQSGEPIRKFQGPAKPGINRTTWNLERDGFRLPRGEEDEPSEFLPPGPEVLPGSYTVRVKHGDAVATAPVEVRGDPRAAVSLADRTARLELLMRAGRRGEVVAEALQRIRDTKKAVDQLLEQTKSRDDSAAKALGTAGKDLKTRLDGLEERFAGPQGRQGISGSPDAVSSVLFEVYGSLSSSWEAPTEAERIGLEHAERVLGAALDELNAAFAAEVAAFRAQVESLGLERLPAREPLTLDWRPEQKP